MTGYLRQESFWDIEDTPGVIHVRDMTIAPVGAKDVHDFCKRYHYTKTGGNMQYRWGLWHGPTLHGVVAYNLPTKEVCVSVFGEDSMLINPDVLVNSDTTMFDSLKREVSRKWRPGMPGQKVMNVLHMGRLAFAEHSPRNSESRLIGGSLKEIERTMPHIWAVVTYADSTQGHIGYVYQATNALYTGTGGDSTYYIDHRGERRGTYFHGNHVDAATAMERGWSVHTGGAKHRYLYILGNKTQRKQRRKLLKYPVLPYPKG